MFLFDRYVLRLIAPGTALGIFVFTFVLLLNELVRNVRILVDRGADLGTVGPLLLHLVPGILAISIPTALLFGILLALNRLGAGSELIALRASGVGASRLLLPIAAASVLAWGVSSYLMIAVVPDSNRRFVDLAAEVLNARVRSEIHPRVFYDDFLDEKVLLVGEVAEGGAWERVFLADTRNPEQPTIFVAPAGRMVISARNRVAYLELDDVEVHNAPRHHPGRYRIQRAEQVRIPLDAEAVFGAEEAAARRNVRAMPLSELREAYRENPRPDFLVEIHKKFALPAACLVFGLLGLGLGLRPGSGTRGSAFLIAVAVVLAYYVPLTVGEQMAIAGDAPPWAAMWGANLAAAALGLGLARGASRERDPIGGAVGWVARLFRDRLRIRDRFSRIVRRFRAPGLPTLVDRYVLTLFALFFLVALAALASVLMIGRLVDILPAAIEREIGVGTVLRYLGLGVPEIVLQMLPLATLAATLVTFGALSRTAEITALLAGGVSRARLAVPALGFGVLASALCLGLQERVLPATSPEAETLGARIRGRPARVIDPLGRHWHLGPRGDIHHYETFDHRLRVLTGLSIYETDGKGSSLVAQTFASDAHWSEEEGEWTGTGGWRRGFDQGGAAESFAVRALPGMPPPEAFLRRDLLADQLPYDDLKTRIETIEAAGHSAVALRVDLNAKAALPLAPLVTVLIGVPFAFSHGNRSGIQGAAAALGIGIVFLVALRLFGFLGDAGLLAPGLAAWSPNLFFGLASVYLLFRRRS